MYRLGNKTKRAPGVKPGALLVFASAGWCSYELLEEHHFADAVEVSGAEFVEVESIGDGFVVVVGGVPDGGVESGLVV